MYCILSKTAKCVSFLATIVADLVLFNKIPICPNIYPYLRVATKLCLKVSL